MPVSPVNNVEPDLTVGAFFCSDFVAVTFLVLDKYETTTRRFAPEKKRSDVSGRSIRRDGAIRGGVLQPIS
jgi:hypothetical protein